MMGVATHSSTRTTRIIAPPLASLRGCACIMLFCTSLFVSAQAQDYTISRVVFLPSIYHVGDRVELRLSIEGLSQDLSLPQQLFQPEWGSIHDIRIINREDEKDIRIQFTSYYPGTQTIPPIDLGAIVIEDIAIFVTSLLEGTELVSSRGQVVLPGTQIIIIFAALLLFSLPLMWFPFIKWFRRYVRRLTALYQDGKPYRRIEDKLKELTARTGFIDGRNFYIQLLDLVREYLSARIQQNVKVATTEELEAYLRKSLENPEYRNFIIQLFHHGDLVKFASQPSTLKSRMNHLEQLETVFAHIESTRETAGKKSIIGKGAAAAGTGAAGTGAAGTGTAGTDAAGTGAAGTGAAGTDLVDSAGAGAGSTDPKEEQGRTEL